LSENPRLTPEQEERLARYRAGGLTPEERAAFEREVAESEVLAEELYAELALEDVRAPAPARTDDAMRPAPLRARGGAWLRALPVAAAVIAVSAVGWWLARPHDRPGAGDVLRGGGGEPRLLEPAGALAAPPRWLRWNAVPGADHYRVELFDDSGRGLGTVVTADTAFAIDSLAHRPLDAGEWRVVPIEADGRERAPLGRATFRVGTGR
jgi:hypothetical protein